jgi:LysR family transcriptional regulator, transcriptional activator of the cysJI operon
MAHLENARVAVFRAVAQQLSFRKAAEELYLTQPAVSLQIKALEEDLGIQLFDRSGSRVALTAAGKTLLGYAEKAHALLQRAEHEVAAMGGELAGRLALGASTTIAQYVLPRMLGEFFSQFPRVQPSLISGNTEHIVDALIQHQIALGFIEGPSRSKDVKSEPFLTDELVLIVPAAHEWAERRDVAVSELRAVPLLMRERGSGTRRVVEIALEQHHVRPASLKIAMELDSTEAIKSAVEAGLGAGFVSKWAIAKDSRTGTSFKVVEMDTLRMRREFLIVYLAGPEPQGLAQTFRRFVMDRAAMTREAGHRGRKPKRDAIAPSVQGILRDKQSK